MKSGEWHSSDAPAPDPDLSFEEVLFFLRYIRSMEADWETVFSALQIEPLRLCYEDLVTDQPAVLERIRRHLNVNGRLPRQKSSPFIEPSARGTIPAGYRGCVMNLRPEFEGMASPRGFEPLLSP